MNSSYFCFIYRICTVQYHKTGQTIQALEMHLVFERYVKDPPCLAAAANNPLAWKFDCDEQGTKGEWVRCNYSAALDSYVDTTVEYHLLLARKGYHGWFTSQLCEFLVTLQLQNVYYMLINFPFVVVIMTCWNLILLIWNGFIPSIWHWMITGDLGRPTAKLQGKLWSTVYTWT